MNPEKKEWAHLSQEEKKQQLFLNQKKTLDLFLERGAISQAQYDKCNLRSPTATGAVANGHSAVRQRPA